MAHDLLRQISDARAQMMMRGFEPLMLEMGPQTAKAFATESRIADINDYFLVVANMAISIRSDMEGWAVCAALEQERNNG